MGAKYHRGRRYARMGLFKREMAAALAYQAPHKMKNAAPIAVGNGAQSSVLGRTIQKVKQHDLLDKGARS